MANEVALVTAARVRVVESIMQMTLPCTEAVAAGDAVRIHTDGRWTKANGTAAGEALPYGIATRSAIAGETVTAIRYGVMDGFVLDALAYQAAIFLSDTDGRLSTVAGTVSNVIGRVIPAWSQQVGVAADKLLHVDCREGVVA